MVGSSLSPSNRKLTFDEKVVLLLMTFDERVEPYYLRNRSPTISVGIVGLHFQYDDVAVSVICTP